MALFYKIFESHDIAGSEKYHTTEESSTALINTQLLFICIFVDIVILTSMGDV